ncbi:methyltransferase domain-containing protein [Frankia sp. Allo2]|uniref:class I SAM-dependent methyltransferase n=1 Tax=unclassified Frankia TaxID=2632575 RepID=UPI000AC34517
MESPDNIADSTGTIDSIGTTGPTDRTSPSHTGPSHTGPSHTGPSHTGPSHTGPSHTGPSHTDQDGSAPLPAYGYRDIDPDTARRASRFYWDDAAADYQSEHGAFLGDSDFCWCPEGLRESEIGLLGDVAGKVVLEVGCGGAQCARWLRGQGARVVGFDLSGGQLDQARALGIRTGIDVPLVQADATALPFAAASVDVACSAFGAVPFVADSGTVMREIARVLRPGGRWVFSTTHPFVWCLPDDPDENGLRVFHSYFDRRAYTEHDEQGSAIYTETHRTMGDRVREIVAAGLILLDVIEPEWPPGQERAWGQWGPIRGGYVPSTSIFVTQLPSGASGADQHGCGAYQATDSTPRRADTLCEQRPRVR